MPRRVVFHVNTKVNILQNADVLGMMGDVNTQVVGMVGDVVGMVGEVAQSAHGAAESEKLMGRVREREGERESQAAWEGGAGIDSGCGVPHGAAELAHSAHGAAASEKLMPRRVSI